MFSNIPENKPDRPPLKPLLGNEGIGKLQQQPKADLSPNLRQSVIPLKDKPVAAPVDMRHPEFRFELLNMAAVGDVVRAILKDTEFNKNVVVEKGTKFSGYEVIELDNQKKIVRVQGPNGVVTDLTRKSHVQSQNK